MSSSSSGSFPTLYKKTSTGATQMWSIAVSDNIITTIFGQVGGKLQEAQEVVREGKNQGKKNATTPAEQAIAEARATWEGKKKKGYVESVDDARSGAVDEKFVEGGVNPMLAQTLDKAKGKLKYPLAVQPKLDGHRCIAVVSGGKCTLWSRTRKPINSVPHIVAAVEAAVAKHGLLEVVLDGELYNHDYRSNFEELTSLIRPAAPKQGHEVVQYHVYDLADAGKTFEERCELLGKLGLGGVLVHVPTEVAATEEVAMELFASYLSIGYEGAMARNLQSLYEFKRSFHLVKMKEFEDAEFEIVGADEGKGRLEGHVGSFVLKTAQGKTFNAKMVGETARLADMWRDREKYKGKLLTVKYQGHTADGIPRFPVGLRIREDI